MQYGLSLMFTKVFIGWDVGACHKFPDCRVFAAAEFVLLIVCRSQVLVPSFCLCSKSACCFFPPSAGLYHQAVYHDMSCCSCSVDHT